MNVELPDGTVVEDVPDGITRADLATKLKANGMNVPDEWLAKRKVGGVESALRTAGEAARKAVGMFDMAAVGMARLLGGEQDVQETLDIHKARQEGMRDAYAQKPDEEFSPAGQLLGGVASMPIEMAGGMGAQHGFERATEVIDRGGSLGQAGAAGATTGAVHAALNALPVKAGGAVGKAVESRLGALAGGAATGGAIAGAGGMAGRAVENAALPEGKQFEDLKQDTGPDLVEIGMGAAFGALPGAAAAHGKRKKERAAAKAQADAAVFPTDKMTDLGDGEFRAPNGATITQEAWENASPRVRAGWLKASEKVPVGEAKELDIKPEDIERQAEIDRIKQEHPAGPVAEALREVEARRAKAAEKEAAATKTRADAAELRRAAGLIKDPEVQAELRARADKLDPPGKIPAGKATEGQPELPDETPKEPIPVGEATELPVERVDVGEPIPVGEAREITPERGADAPEGEIPTGEATEMLPVGEATEVPRIPTGEASELLPTGEATEIPNKIPVGKATEIDPERIEPGAPDGQQLRPDDLQPEARTEGAQAAGREETTFQDAAGKEADETLTPFPKIDETMISRMGEVLARQDYQPAEVPRVQATRALTGLVKKLDEGKINPASFEWKVKALAERMTHAAETKAANRMMAERERGADIVRERLLAARRRGETDPDGVDLAMWAIDKNPAIAERLSLSVRASPEGVKALGDYNPASEIVRIFKDHANAQTAAHEIMHHTERMMPDAVRQGIRKEWTKAYAKALAATKPGSVQRQVMQDFLPMMAGDAKARERVLKSFQGGVLDKETHYQLTNPSEFWAVNAARILHERFTGRGSWRAQAQQWLREMFEKVKGIIGVRSDAAVLKALGNVLDPKQNTGAKRSKHMLSEVNSTGEFKDVEAPTRAKLTEETPTEARERHVVDSLKPVERAQAVVAPKDEGADMRLAMKLAPGRIGDRAKKLEQQFVEPIGKAMKQAKKAGLTVKDVDDYLTALHAPERNAVIAQRNAKMQDGGSGLTNQQAQGILDSFTPEQRKHLDGISKLVRDMNNAKLDAMVADGVITKDMRTKLDAQFKHYVPLKTLDKEDAFTGVGRGFEMRPTDIQYTLGRTSRASSPLAASMLDATRAISRGERARVDKSIWEYAQNEDARGLIREYHPNQPPPELMKNEMGSDGKVKQVIDSEKLREHTVSLVIDGQQKRLYVPDPELAKALKTAGDPEQVGQVLRAVGTLTRVFSRTLTEWNPAFAPVNSVRDAITAAIRAKRLGVDAAAVVAGIPQAMKDIAQFKRGKAGKGADEYREMREIGGAQGAYGLTKFGDMLADLEKRGAELGYDEHKGGAGRKFSKALSTVGDALGHYNEVFEYATRLSAYRNAITKGMTPKQAAAVARDITLDFNVSGTLGRQMGHAYSFFNAAIQGISADVRDLRDPRTKLRMLSLLGIGAAVQVANDMLGGENEATGEKNIDAQHEGIQDSNIVLQPFGAKIPLPPGIAAGLYAIGRRLMKLVLRGGENAESEVAGIASAMLKSTLPVRFGESEAGTISNALQAVVPSIPAPFYHLETNRDGLGNPILPETFGKTDRPYYTTSRSTTSGAAKGVSQGLNTLTGGDDVTPGASQRYLGKYASPEAIDYLVGYFTGGAGQLALQASNIAKNAAAGKPQAVDKIPVLKRFVVTEPKSYVSRRYKELGEDFERANTYRKKGQDDRVEPRVSQALDEYLVAEKQIDRIVKELRTADENRKEEIWAEVKAVQSRVIKAYNRGANQ